MCKFDQPRTRSARTGWPAGRILSTVRAVVAGVTVARMLVEVRSAKNCRRCRCRWAASGCCRVVLTAATDGRPGPSICQPSSTYPSCRDCPWTCFCSAWSPRRETRRDETRRAKARQREPFGFLVVPLHNSFKRLSWPASVPRPKA